MGKVISLDAYRHIRKKKLKKDHPLAAQTVPVCTYSKGKFTLAIEHDGSGAREGIVYNTTTKIVIAREMAPGCGDLDTLKKWGEAVVDEWQKEHGH